MATCAIVRQRERHRWSVATVVTGHDDTSHGCTSCTTYEFKFKRTIRNDTCFLSICLFHFLSLSLSLSLSFILILSLSLYLSFFHYLFVCVRVYVSITVSQSLYQLFYTLHNSLYSVSLYSLPHFFSVRTLSVSHSQRSISVQSHEEAHVTRTIRNELNSRTDNRETERKMLLEKKTKRYNESLIHRLMK